MVSGITRREFIGYTGAILIPALTLSAQDEKQKIPQPAKKKGIQYLQAKQGDVAVRTKYLEELFGDHLKLLESKNPKGYVSAFYFIDNKKHEQLFKAVLAKECATPARAEYTFNTVKDSTINEKGIIVSIQDPPGFKGKSYLIAGSPTFAFEKEDDLLSVCDYVEERVKTCYEGVSADGTPYVNENLLMIPCRTNVYQVKACASPAVKILTGERQASPERSSKALDEYCEYYGKVHAVHDELKQTVHLKRGKEAFEWVGSFIKGLDSLMASLVDVKGKKIPYSHDKIGDKYHLARN